MLFQWSSRVNPALMLIAATLLSFHAQGAVISFHDLEVSRNIRGTGAVNQSQDRLRMIAEFQATPVGYVELEGDCETTVVDEKTGSLSECADLCDRVAECVGFSFESVDLCLIKSRTCVSPVVSNKVFYAKTSDCSHCYGVLPNGTVLGTTGSCYQSPINNSQCMMNGFICSSTFDSGEYTKCSMEAAFEDDWGAPPIIGDYDPDKVVVWEEESSVPKWLSTSMAMVWITMVAGMPLIAIVLEGSKITKIQLVTFAIMWFVFLGGVYLFTHILLFQSIHFRRIRSLTTVEAVYLLAQILTTVGYGDITPAKPRGQVFIAIYVLMSLVIIANVTSQVASLIAERTAKLTEKIDEMKDVWDVMVGNPIDDPVQAEDTPSQSPAVSPRSAIFTRPEPPKVDYARLVRMAMIYAFFVMIGVLFWHFYPGEGKTWLQGVYMSVITLSTVGFGAFTPQTEAGKVFGAFWMLWGSMALLGLVGAFAEVHEQRKCLERWNPDEANNQKEAVIEKLGDKFKPADFLKEYLIARGLMKEAEVEDLEHLFDHMGPDKNGVIQKSKLEEYFAQDAGIVPQVAG